jgi:hypothetical protein
MIVCMLNPGISGRITMKHAAVLLVTALCCGLLERTASMVSLLKMWACSVLCRHVFCSVLHSYTALTLS